MEKTFLVVLLLCVSGLLWPSGVPLVLCVEIEALLPSGVPEQPTEEVTEEAANPNPADEPVYESTFVTTTIEELPDALLPQSDAAILDQPTIVPPEKAISTDQEVPPPQETTSTDQEAPAPQEAVSNGQEAASPQGPISTDQEAAPTQEDITVDQEAVPSQEADSPDHEFVPTQEVTSINREDSPKQEVPGTGQEASPPREGTVTVQEKRLKASDPVEAASSEEEEEKETCEQQTSAEGMRRLAKDMTAFTIDLFKQVDQESNQPNIVISPLSISLGLSQLALGAGPETEKKLLQALHVNSSQCLHKTLKSLRKNLGKRLLRLATRMYIRKGFEVKEEFRKSSENFYGAKPVTLGQSKKQNLGLINSWVKTATDGQISEFLSQVPDDLMLLLINAMHFKGIWKTNFDSSQTSEERFYLTDKQMVTVQMMRNTKYPLSYFHMENVDAQVARFPFKGNMSFIVVLPNHYKLDTAKLLDTFNQTEMYSLFSKESTTLVKVPKLQLDFKLELSQALTRLGLGELFFSPDLRGISDEALAVSSIQHQSTLELNEEGVEAAAATSIQVSRSIHHFSLNRPFIFFLLDDLTGIPLFLGRVGNPNPSAPVQITDQNDSPFNKDDKYFMKGYDPK